MINNRIKNECTGCAACSAICPKNCINMKTDELGFLYPNINVDECINCGLCDKVCSINFRYDKTTDQKKAFSAFNKIETVREKSSSGGVFSSMSEYIIKNDGVVVGAAFDDAFEKVKHIVVDNIYDLYKIRGSKYIQSNIYSIYENVKKYLKIGKSVLFSGTPCQIYAIKNYLGKEYKNLYLVEVACHGVPSPFVWKQYLQSFKKKQKANVVDVQFRYKNPSWEQYYMKISYDNNKQYLKKGSEDLYMRGFVKDIYLRPSCYNCKHKGDNSCADITLADFWGITKIFPDLNDDKGISLVVVNTDKGMQIFSAIKESLHTRETNLTSAIQNNPSLIKSSSINSQTQNFLREFNKKDIHLLLRKYCGTTIFNRIKRKLKSFVK